MNAHELLTLAQGYGVEVRANGEKLKVHFDENQPPPANLIDLLRNHKADLMAYLASQPKHPVHHTGVYVALTANQSRALAAVGTLLRRAQQRLARLDKPISDAEVSVTEWHKKVMQRLALSRDQMRDLERGLINLGMIKIDNHRNYLSLSDSRPLTQQQQVESESLAWDGYRSFSQWLYS